MSIHQPAALAEILRRFPGVLPDAPTSLINGRPVTGEGETGLVYAATDEALADVSNAPPALVDRAVAAARDTFEQGDWRDRPAAGRSRTLYAVAEKIRAHAEELAVLHTLETGIPLAQAQGMHIPRTAENFQFFGEVLSTLSGETYQQTGKYLTLVTREPVGVAALIAPWNAPLVLSSMKMAACIALGNSMVVKPSEHAPLSVLRMVALMHEAGLPEGVVQVVTGPGGSTGQALVDHAGIDAVGFIGGTRTGRLIMQAAGRTLKKVGLELGGKSANIVLDSADLPAAVDGALMSIYAGNGEQCLAGARILVHRAVADRFIDAFVQRSAALRVGDPFADDTELGPMAFRAHYERVRDYGTLARQTDGCTVLTGGGPAEGFERGLFFQPTVVQVSDNRVRLCQEEIFGPFATIQVVADLDQALSIANDSDFGLVSYVWSDHMPSILKASRALRAGTVWVNTPMARDLRAPFGGVKQSGIGRDGLPGSIELFSEEKTTMLPSRPLPLPKLGMAGAE